MRFKRLSLIAGACFVVVAATLALTGSVVLFDPHRTVASARLIDGWGHSQPLLNLVYLRVGVPKIEGAVQITCENGTTVKLDYVTPGAPTWLQVDDSVGCSTAHS